jgi:hypothetical protein
VSRIHNWAGFPLTPPSLWYTSVLGYKHVSRTDYARNPRFYCILFFPSGHQVASYVFFLVFLLLLSPSFIFPSITHCRRQFLRKMWPIHFAFRLCISCRIFLCSFFIPHMISPTDLFHPSPAPHFKTFQVFRAGLCYKNYPITITFFSYFPFWFGVCVYVRSEHGAEFKEVCETLT